MTVDTARQAAEMFASHLATREGGAVAVIHLDSDRRLLDITIDEVGTDELPVRDILAEALRLGTVALIVARSRPGGDPLPTEADRAAARRLADAAAALGMRLIDHFIFAGADCRSFRELGLL